MNAHLHKQEALLAAVKANNIKETEKLLKDHGLALDRDFSDYKLLVQSLNRGQKQIAKLLLQNGCRVICSQKTSIRIPSYTPLYYAVNLKCLELVQILLKKGASIKGTPLYLAVDVQNDDHMEILKLLIKNNADVYATDDDGNTAIHKAFEIMQKNKSNQTAKAVINLLFSACQENLKNLSNSSGISLFHIACATSNDPELIKKFSKKKLHINACVKKDVEKVGGYTGLQFAVMAGNLKVIDILVQKHVSLKMYNPNKQSSLYCICEIWFQDVITEITSFTEQSPTKALKDENIRLELTKRIRSITEKRYPIFQLFLIKKETNDLIMSDVCNLFLKSLNGFMGTLPPNQFNGMVISEFFAIFKAISVDLINHGYIREKNQSGEPILNFLIRILTICYSPCIIDIIEFLLIQGAYVDIEGSNCLTPLMEAASYGFDEIVEILLKYKADPNKSSAELNTPILLALMTAINTLILNPTADVRNISQTVDQLIAQGADIDAQNKDKCTPLHLAAKDPILNSVLLQLLQHNCKVNSRDSCGLTALHVACFQLNLSGIRTLLNYGADINLKDNRNYTALEILLKLSSDMYLKDFCDFTAMQTLFKLTPNVLIRVAELFEMLKIFELHIMKLKFIGFTVSKKNNCAYKKIKSSCRKQQIKLYNPEFVGEDNSTTCDENDIFIDFIQRELERLKNVKIDSYTSLYSILVKSAHGVSKYVNNQFFKELIQSRDFTENFPLYGHMIANLQYKKGLQRYKLLQPVKNVLPTLLNLPELCCWRILSYFTNEDLKILSQSN